PLRECIEIANLVFPFERAGGIAASLSRKIAEHQGNREKDNDTEDARSRTGARHIEWAVEEQGEGRSAADGGYGGRQRAPDHGGHDDRNDEGQRNRRQCLDILHEQKKSLSGDNENERHDDTGDTTGSHRLANPDSRKVKILHCESKRSSHETRLGVQTSQL